jgi:phosphopantetheine--protein transferase-like protein
MNALGLAIGDPASASNDGAQPECVWPREWNEPVAAFQEQFGSDAPLVCCRIDSFSPELADCMLSERERRQWISMRAVEKRRREWLLGRAVAKDAVGRLVEMHCGVRLLPTAIEIVPDPFGRPLAEGVWTSQWGRPAISISHSEGAAVALAAGPELAVGIDIESLSRRQENFAEIAFSVEERQWLASLPPESRQPWALRFWCAKEALAKALGRGLTAGLLAYRITQAEIETGRVMLELRDEALSQSPKLRGCRLTGYTTQDADFVFATMIYPQGAIQ